MSLPHALAKAPALLSMTAKSPSLLVCVCSTRSSFMDRGKVSFHNWTTLPRWGFSRALPKRVGRRRGGEGRCEGGEGCEVMESLWQVPVVQLAPIMVHAARLRGAESFWESSEDDSSSSADTSTS